MNVYVLAVAKRLAEMGIEVDVFSRWSGIAERIRHVAPGLRVIHLEAGPHEPVPKEDLPEHLCEFLYALLAFGEAEAARAGIDGPFYDVIHSHYWLSGWVGRRAAERWGIPLVQSFHTLGRVKNQHAGPGDRPEPADRITAEERIIEDAACVLAPTRVEAAELVRLYGADPARVRVVSPGVDTDLFRPGRVAPDGPGPTILFAGRLQPLKAPDLAIESLAALDDLMPDPAARLVIVGGPSGAASTSPEELTALAARLGVGDRVTLRDPAPHHVLRDLYRAADVVIVPSRTESFGLVALEASACGTPVVASDVGGLRTAVRHGETGLLVEERAPAAFAAALHAILSDDERRSAMGEAAARYARRFDWRVAACGLLDTYEDVSVASVAG